ncbi:toll/interleukin-1 receptor domain-containing protein [Paenarthrobacter sp. MSM-2-10-13]|uniref:toll/interleukin-1 receptor domain-containing protein n=1 Tax=unclassified Paenarthrobacter TaxID=2634190 RepID=UPI00141FBA86|nr:MULTISPECIES: toll/interleukin-1 receptor domain-containing protein [unclassified Paenarthrobacter]MCM0615990.1 toll/interleukin-1 receptor domain-containing protein [Paenarthrobacter sp. TYUT067]NHW48221.1 toll/interleukin-1 receptor domain-containing protein [Paenarthrobacter sp. MSM-2-10-13]
MADFVISYASVERNRAQQVVETLRSSGHSVWMDKATDAGGLIRGGIPGGQEHWKIIQAAIDDASTFLILETAAWHQSKYCADEHQHAKDMGKRVAALGDGIEEKPLEVFARAPEHQPLDLLPQLSEGNNVAAAHARLVAELNSGTSPRIGFGRLQIKDAQLLSMAQLPQFGLAKDSELTARVDKLLKVGRGRRRWLGISLAVVIATLATLSVVASVASQQAGVSSAAAVNRANYTASLQLAQQAMQAQTTSDSVQLAQRGYDLDNNDATRAALKAVNARTYRSTVVVPSGTASSAAISNDGRSALVIQGSSLYVTDVAAGQVTTLPLTSGSSLPLAISPDGRFGFWISTSGALGCIDVPDHRITESVQTKVVAIDVDETGGLWWINADGSLFRSMGCPTEASRPVSSGFGSVAAFHITASPANIFTLTTNGVVHVRKFAPSATTAGPPSKEITVGLVPADSDSSRNTTTPDSASTNRLFQCGEVVHVVAGFKGPLKTSAHVALSLAGEPVSKKFVGTELNGLGCAPDGKAWGVPMLDARPQALPSGGSVPADGIDERDRSTRVVIANSADSSHSIVVHADGRVDLLTIKSVPWASAVANAVVAVPIRDGVVTVTSSGQAQLVNSAGSSSLGSLESAPSPWTVTHGGTAYVAAGDRVFAITVDGIRASPKMPGTISTMRTADQGNSVIVSGSGFVAQLSLDFSTPAQEISLPKLSNGELVSSVVLDEGRQILATSFGNVLVVDGVGNIIARAATGVAGITHARVLPDHTVVVVGGSGRINKYTKDLQLLNSQMFGPMAADIQVSEDGHTLLVALTGSFSVWVVDGENLQPIAKVATKADARLVKISPDGHTVVQLIPPTASSDEPARIVRTIL